MFNPNPAFLLVQKFEISTKSFTLGVKAEIEKKHFNLPEVLTNAELYGLVWAPRLKEEGYHQI
jgi:hypothetical protein